MVNYKLTEYPMCTREVNALVVLLLALLFSVPASTMAQDENTKEKLVIGARIGPAIPSAEVANVYDILVNDDVGAAYETATKLGYSLAANARIGLSNTFSLSGGISFVQFPGQSMTLTDSLGHRYDLTTSTVFVPITAGISWLPIHSVLVPIIHAEALLNYRKSIVSDGNIVTDLLKPGMEVDPEATRIGAQVGVTLEIDLGIRPQIDVTYVLSNLAGKKPGELDKNYLVIGIGIIL